MRRIVGTTAALLLLVAGCARTSGTGAPRSSAFDDRAAQVAAAWSATTGASRAWRTGFIPLDDPTRPPPGGFPTDALKVAFTNGWYRSRVALPAHTQPPGRVRFVGGSTLTVPLDSVQVAYGKLYRGRPSCAPAQQTCAYLTITGVRLGTAEIRTSRGVATVPAWLFSVAELSAPIVRVAVAASAVTPVPHPSVAPVDPSLASTLAGASDLTAARGTTLTYTVGIGACEGQPVPVAYETGDVVVVAALRTDLATSGPCPDVLALQPVTATLKAPLDNRVVLDAVGGAPLPVG